MYPLQYFCSKCSTRVAPPLPHCYHRRTRSTTTLLPQAHSLDYHIASLVLASFQPFHRLSSLSPSATATAARPPATAINAADAADAADAAECMLSEWRQDEKLVNTVALEAASKEETAVFGGGKRVENPPLTFPVPAPHCFYVSYQVHRRITYFAAYMMRRARARAKGRRRSALATRQLAAWLKR